MADRRARRLRRSLAARKTKPGPPAGLPASLLTLFWDLPARRLTWSRDRDLIVSRVLARGGWGHARILRQRLGDPGIREWILAHDARGLSPARVRFWELLLDLPKGKADRWVRSARASVWGKRHRYRLLREPLRLPGVPVALASIEDIACMKLSAVTQRGARKDFVDLHAMGQRLRLPEMLRLYQKKFGLRDVGPVLMALTYFDEADRERAPQMLRRVEWTEVKATLRGWVKAHVG